MQAILAYLCMVTKKEKRLTTILELVGRHSIRSQEDLLVLLQKRGFGITQATLSRDIKRLKLVKLPDAKGNYLYAVSGEKNLSEENSYPKAAGKNANPDFLSMDFSNNLAVIKTRPGYAMGIASDIDNRMSHAILATIAGDDTILVIPRDGFDRNQIVAALRESNIHL